LVLFGRKREEKKQKVKIQIGREKAESVKECVKGCVKPQQYFCLPMAK